MDDQRTEVRSSLLHPTFPRYSPWPSSLKSFPIHSYLSFLAVSHLSSLCFHSDFLFPALLLSFARFVFHRFAPVSPLPCLISARPICSLTMDHSPFLLKVTTLLFALPDAESLSARLLSPAWQENREGGRATLPYTHLAKRMRALRGGCYDLGFR